MLTETVNEMQRQLRDGSISKISTASLHDSDQRAVATVQNLLNTIAGRGSENWALHAGNCKQLLDKSVELMNTFQDVADTKPLASTPLSTDTPGKGGCPDDALVASVLVNVPEGVVPGLPLWERLPQRILVHDEYYDDINHCCHRVS